MQDNNITDVEFKEVPTETAAPTTSEKFLPANYVVNALTAAGHPNPLAWALHIDPRVETAEEEKDRIFFANRALRIYISEQEVPDNISPRMLLAEGIPADKWCALVDKGIVPWLMGQFDSKGQRIDQQKVEEVLAEEGVAAAPVVELKEYEGDLILTEEEKAQVRNFFTDGAGEQITIGDKIFAVVHRNGAFSREWGFVSEPTVRYALSHYSTMAAEGEEESFASSTEPTTLADKINAMAPASRTVNFNLSEGQAPVIGADEAAPGSTDSLPGSITE